MRKYIAATTAGIALMISVMIIPNITQALAQRNEHPSFPLEINPTEINIPIEIRESTIVTDSNNIHTHISDCVTCNVILHPRP
jgi:hypothetical protein